MSEQLSDWFRRRTFRCDDFDVNDLIRRKASSATTVSAVLPAVNEADTVAGVVRAAAALQGTLIDELIVIDGGSADATAKLAAEAGAVVYRDTEILPSYGPTHGKGDALWRGLSISTGDVVVYVDTDIRNPDPRFFWGLLGPLLHDPQVELVKAFYERPVQLEQVLYPTGGGRVTELMARPLLNLFWPQLAGLVQPLSGEYAGRRGLLESIPFFTGYGVELGMLVDTLAARGADAIAQVDLFERVHRNQRIDSLSRMAYGIAHAALRRLTEQGRASFMDIPGLDYVQFAREDGRVQPQDHELQLRERPPLRSLREAPLG